MIDSSVYLTRKVKVFIWAFVLATFCFIFYILFERGFSGAAHEKFSVEPSQAIELTLDQFLKNVEVSVGSDNGFKDTESLSYARLSQSEIHEVDEWVNDIEYTPENRRIYQSYSDEVIFQLASEGDRNALEEGAQRMVLRGDSQTALQMLHEAAELGSTSALISTGYWIQNQLKSSSVDEALYNRMFGNLSLPELSAGKREFLEKLSAAYYMAAMMRGNVHMSAQYLEGIQKDTLGRPFREDEKSAVYGLAQGLYDRLEARRIERGLDAFNSQYPESYAKLYGLPEEASQLRQLIHNASTSE